jgi:large subunit ribosomal protein L24
MSKAKLRIKRDDTVVVVAGSEKGKIGRVLKVMPEDARVVVEGIRKVNRHVKPTGDRPGSIVEKEASIHVSNVALWNATEGRKVKVGYTVQEDGKKVRVDRSTGAVIENG